MTRDRGVDSLRLFLLEKVCGSLQARLVPTGRIRPLLHVGSDVDGPNGDQRADTVALAPAEEIRHGARVCLTRVGIADVGGKKFDKTGGGVAAGVADQSGKPELGAVGDRRWRGDNGDVAHRPSVHLALPIHRSMPCMMVSSPEFAMLPIFISHNVLYQI